MPPLGTYPFRDEVGGGNFMCDLQFINTERKLCGTSSVV